MKNVMGIIFGNIHEKEIPEITACRTLGSVPFGGRYRLIDFALSNMANSGINKVGIITKKNYQSLMTHVGSGKPWDMSRKMGGLSVLPPFGAGNSGTYRSRFEALENNIRYIKNSDDDYVIMTDCDAVCNFDFDSALMFHKHKQADITLIYRKKDLGASSDKVRTIVSLGNDGVVTNIECDSAFGGIKNVYTNMMIIGRTFLLGKLAEISKAGRGGATHDLLIDGCRDSKIYGYELNGYFASIDSVPNYYKHSLELLEQNNRAMLFDNNGAKIFTKVHDSPPCKLSASAKVSNSLIADGCVIEGEVHNSILFRGVKVEKGAIVKGSILFQDTVVECNSQLNCVITDKNCRILEGRNLSGHETHPYYMFKGSII